MGAPSGEQLRIVLGDQEAVITEVGASLRRYAVGGRDVVAGFPEDEIARSGRGQVLAPWPNRLSQGEYAWEGVAGRAALDEPERNNAIHGLVRWLAWRVGEREDSSVALSCPLVPQPAYPFALDLEVRYSLTPGGLTVTAEARCGGAGPAPFGIGFHPYLTVGSDVIDAATLRLPAHRRLLLDEQGLPVGEEEVAGSRYDFRSARPIGDLVLDDCFAGLDDGAGSGAGSGPADGAVAILADPASGREVALWLDGGYPYLMCYTGDTLADEDERRRSIALEPMSCPPNALRTGEGLVRLEPGAGWLGSWGIRPSAGWEG